MIQNLWLVFKYLKCSFLKQNYLALPKWSDKFEKNKNAQLLFHCNTSRQFLLHVVKRAIVPLKHVWYARFSFSADYSLLSQGLSLVPGYSTWHAFFLQERNSHNRIIDVYAATSLEQSYFNNRGDMIHNLLHWLHAQKVFHFIWVIIEKCI